MKCIIILDDPTPFLNDPRRNWAHSGGDPNVFIETRKIWQNTINNLKDPDFQIYFSIRNPDMDETYNRIDFDNHVIYNNGDNKNGLGDIETYKKDWKLIDKYFEYDFIVTTTLGSFWVLPKLKKYLESLYPYKGIYTGNVQTHLDIPYISGSCIILSKDVIQLFQSHKELHIDHIGRIGQDYDDYAIGCFLKTYNIIATDFNATVHIEYDPEINIDECDKKEIFHYRVKVHKGRLHYDPIVLNSLFEYYKNKFYEEQ
jgi:hypothetical protein